MSEWEHSTRACGAKRRWSLADAAQDDARGSEWPRRGAKRRMRGAGGRDSFSGFGDPNPKRGGAKDGVGEGVSRRRMDSSPMATWNLRRDSFPDPPAPRSETAPGVRTSQMVVRILDFGL